MSEYPDGTEAVWLRPVPEALSRCPSWPLLSLGFKAVTPPAPLKEIEQILKEESHDRNKVLPTHANAAAHLIGRWSMHQLAQLKKILPQTVEDLGLKIGDLFEHFDAQPMAAASIAQALMNT